MIGVWSLVKDFEIKTQSMGMSDVIWKGSIKKEEKRAYDQTLRTLTLRSGKGISKGN